MDKPVAFFMTLTLRIWRQKNRRAAGRLVDYQVQHISLENIATLNREYLAAKASLQN
jgi:hypothetical protein